MRSSAPRDIFHDLVEVRSKKVREDFILIHLDLDHLFKSDFSGILIFCHIVILRNCTLSILMIPDIDIITTVITNDMLTKIIYEIILSVFTDSFLAYYIVISTVICLTIRTDGHTYIQTQTQIHKQYILHTYIIKTKSKT